MLGRRIGAAKPARLVTARNARGDQAQERLAERIAAEALGLAADEVKAVGVLVNRVATARMVHEKLTAGGGDPSCSPGACGPSTGTMPSSAWNP